MKPTIGWVGDSCATGYMLQAEGRTAPDQPWEAIPAQIVPTSHMMVIPGTTPTYEIRWRFGDDPFSCAIPVPEPSFGLGFIFCFALLLLVKGLESWLSMKKN